MYKSGYISYYFLFLKIKIKTITKHKILLKNVTTRRINIVYICVEPFWTKGFFFTTPRELATCWSEYVCVWGRKDFQASCMLGHVVKEMATLSWWWLRMETYKRVSSGADRSLGKKKIRVT